MVISAIHYHGENKQHYIKRFKIETTTPDKKYCFIDESSASRLEFVSVDAKPRIEVHHKSNIRGAEAKQTLMNVDELIDVKGWKSTGNKLTNDKVTKVKVLAPEVPEEPEEEDDSDDDKGGFSPGDRVDFGNSQMKLF